MDFGTAIDAMKDKRKVARKGWNGKGMFYIMFKQELMRHVPILQKAL